jgi:hypothetical protein
VTLELLWQEYRETTLDCKGLGSPLGVFDIGGEW